jgi:hypothetical protein
MDLGALYISLVVLLLLANHVFTWLGWWDRRPLFLALQASQVAGVVSALVFPHAALDHAPVMRLVMALVFGSHIVQNQTRRMTRAAARSEADDERG